MEKGSIALYRETITGEFIPPGAIRHGPVLYQALVNLATLRWLTLMQYDSASFLPHNNHLILIFSPLLEGILIMLYYCLISDEALPCVFYGLQYIL